MLWRDTALQISTRSRFIPRFFLLPARTRQLLVSACVALGLVATTAQANSDPFQDIITLAGQGAPELALHIIDQQQTPIDPLATDWAAWEKVRILIYQQRRDWASVVRRVQALPDNSPFIFTHWALTQGAAAQLELGQGAAARAWLLRLIWQAANVDSQLFARPPWMAEVPETEEQLFGQWRRMVIHSYIVEGRVDDAYVALLRYQQDYAEDVQTQLLQAHVLLLSGRAGEAATLLAGTQEPTAAALFLLARLRSGGRPEDILQEARQLLKQQEGIPSQGLAAVVQAEAAQMIGDHERHVEAVEYGLAVVRGIPAPSTDGQVPRAQDALERPSRDTCTSCTAYQGVTPLVFPGLFNITDDSVWDAYVAYAQGLSNQQQLLMGDFAPWFAMAQSLVEEHPIRARALFAFLAMRADTVETRVRAHQQLVTLLGQLPQGAALMRALYVKLDRFH